EGACYSGERQDLRRGPRTRPRASTSPGGLLPRPRGDRRTSRPRLHHAKPPEQVAESVELLIGERVRAEMHYVVSDLSHFVQSGDELLPVQCPPPEAFLPTFPAPQEPLHLPEGEIVDR